MNLPFTKDVKEKNNSFLLLNTKQIINRLSKSKTIVNLVKNLVKYNSSKTVSFLKGSETRDYYKKLKTKQK